MPDDDISDRRIIADGASSRVLGLSHDRVLKLYRTTVSDDMIEREAGIAALAGGLGLPAVAPVERINTSGERGLIFPRLHGSTLMTAMRRKPWMAGRLVSGMSDLQRAIHGHVVTGIRPLVDVLATDIIYGPSSPALQQAACAYLDRLPTGNALLHGDFHIGNIILVDGDPFVIDWAKGAMGAPAADLVRTEMLMRFGQGSSDLLTNIWRDWAAARVVSGYVRAGGVTMQDIAMWRPIVALAWLRARAPVRQVAFLRYLNGSLRSAGLPEFTP